MEKEEVSKHVIGGSFIRASSHETDQLWSVNDFQPELLTWCISCLDDEGDVSLLRHHYILIIHPVLLHKLGRSVAPSEMYAPTLLFCFV